MTTAELAELQLLDAMSGGKNRFAIDLGCELATSMQEALERLVMRDYVRFVDVGPMRGFPGRFFRTFVLTQPGAEWFAKNRAILQMPASKVPS